MELKTICICILVTVVLILLFIINHNWYIKWTFQYSKDMEPIKQELKQLVQDLRQELINNRAFIHQMRENESPLNIIKRNNRSGAYWVNESNDRKGE